MNSQFYFRQVVDPVSSDDAAKHYAGTLGADPLNLFRQVNGFGSPRMCYPGETLIAPSYLGVTEQSAHGVAALSEQLAFAHRHARRPPAPRAYNTNFVGMMLTGAGHLTEAIDGASGVHEGMGARLAAVQSKLRGIQQEAFRLKSLTPRSLPYPGAQARLPRQQTGAMLNSKMTLQGKISDLGQELRKAKYRNLPAIDVAHISAGDAARSFKTNGSPMSRMQIARVIATVNDDIAEVAGAQKNLAIPLGPNGGRFAKSVTRALPKIANAAPWVGAGLTLAQGLNDHYETSARAELANERAHAGGDILAIHRAGRSGGSALGSYIGAEAALAVALWVGPVGWTGIAIAGVCIAGAAYFGGKGGEIAGGEAAAAFMKHKAPELSQEVDVITTDKELVGD